MRIREKTVVNEKGRRDGNGVHKDFGKKSMGG
jgi:hypothetical protein